MSKKIQAFKEKPEGFNEPTAVIEIYDVRNALGVEQGIGMQIKFMDKDGNVIDTSQKPEDLPEPTKCHQIAMAGFRAIAELIAESNDISASEVDVSIDDLMSQVPEEELDEVEKMLKDMGLLNTEISNKTKH